MNPFDRIAATIETEGAAIAGVAKSWQEAPGQIVAGIESAATGGLWHITENLAGLSVGLGLFALGLIMIGAAPNDELVQTIKQGVKMVQVPAAAGEAAALL